MKSKVKNFKRLKEYFKKQPLVSLVFAHGSYVSGKMREGSDLDLAVLFRKKPDAAIVLKLQYELSELLEAEVDLAVLNEASPIFARQVLENGKEIFCRNERQKHRFVLKVLNEYEDLKYCRRDIEKHISRGKIFAG